MKVRYRTGAIEFETDVSDRKGAFQFISDVMDLFPDEPCGCCKSKNVRPSVRLSKDYKFYEIACMDCNAKLSFGQKKEGGALFCKRWDAEAKAPLPNKGWSVYKGTEQSGGYRSSAPASQAQDSHPRDETAGGEVPF